MKTLLFAALAIAALSISARAITVSTPTNGARVTSPFLLTASTKTCASLPAVSMGYSIDSGQAVIEPISFSTHVSASTGSHVLHVKCWGQKVHDEVLLNITVLSATSTTTSSDITVTAPYNGASLKSPFTLTASTRTCASLPAVSMGYSIDSGSAIIEPTSFSTSVSTSPGAHVLHVKCWGQQVNDQVLLNINVTSSTTSSTSNGPSIPSYANEEQHIQLLPNWRIKHDPATSGTSTGSMTIVSDPTISGQTAKFHTSFTNSGGELYSVTYGNDSDSKNFVYDAHVWIASGSVLSNLEMDNNQVMSNGDTVIYAFQCSGYANVWEYTANVGTRTSPDTKWIKSTAPCNPASWTRDTWHHFQISYSRDDSGNVTYHSVWVDGVEAPINKTVNSDFALGWALGAMVANFQVDGLGSTGSSTLYLDNFTMYRW